MSVEEDTELRDLVAQTLENNGTLGKIRAQLRAGVFSALEEEDSKSNKNPYLNEKLQQLLKTNDGQLIASLFSEFLSFYNLEFTSSVFEPETGIDLHNLNECKQNRSNMARNLNLFEDENSKKLPLISLLIREMKNDKIETMNKSNLQDLTEEQIEDAKKKFEKYDLDKNGTIEKNELRSLFIDMFPNFHHNMLERYVNDEFKSVDKDFNNTIDFNEFVGMYKRLFILCKSVVAHDVIELNVRPKIVLTKIPKKKNEDILQETKNKANVKKNGIFDNEVPFPNQKSKIQNTSLERSESAKESKELTSLSGLPSLDNSSNNYKSANLKTIDKQIFRNLSIDDPKDYADDFEDDFENNHNDDFNTESRSKGLTDKKNMSENDVEEDIIEEDIDDFGDGSDILKSEKSDGTIDVTVSNSDINKKADYMEDIH